MVSFFPLRNMLTVLLRVLTSRFYQQNAGTFLVVILLAFGFLSTREHKALITAALGSPFLLAIVAVLWALYGLKTVSYVRQVLSAPDHLFLQTFWLVPTPLRMSLWLVIQTTLLFPILAYGGWMMQLAATYRKWDALLAIGLYLMGLVGAGAALNDYRLRHPQPATFRLPRLNVRLPYVLFFPTYWLRSEPLSLVLTKAFSGLLLAGVCRLYPTDDYDERLLLIGLLLAVLGHAQVGGQVSAFERRYLLLLPNLPLSRLQRFGQYGLTYGLIWLPELLILLRNYPADVSLMYILWLWLTGWGWLLLMHGLAYRYVVVPDGWLTGIMAAFVIGLLLIMFGVPVGAWLVLGWLGAAWLSWRPTASVL